MMLTISPLLTVIVLVTLPLYVARHRPWSPNARSSTFAAQQRELGQLNGHVEDMYTGHTIVKAFGHEERVDPALQRDQRPALRGGLEGAVRLRHHHAADELHQQPGLRHHRRGRRHLCVTQGRIAVGDMQAFIQYSQQFTWPIVQTANIANVIQSTIAAAERVFELLDETEEVPDPEHATVLATPHGDVALRARRLQLQRRMRR